MGKHVVRRVLGRVSVAALVVFAGLLAGCGGGSSNGGGGGGGGQQTTPVSFSTSSLPGGMTGTAYSASVAASNGTAPYTFTLASGSLPAGLTLASSGAISGTPTAAGTSTFTVKVTDSSSPQGSATSGGLSITIASGLTVTTTTLPAGTVGAAYSQSLSVSGGTAPYTFALASGASLPAGLSMDTSGNITGTPTAAGTSSFGVTVKDSSSTALTATATLSLTINPAALAIATSSLPGAVTGTAYSESVSVSGGTAPYTFTSSGTLPAGLTLASNGTISGTPTAAGSSTFTVKVTDSASTPQTASASVTIVVSTPLSFTASSLPAAQVGTAYSQSVSADASGGTTPYTFTVSSGTLPAGLTLAANGTLSGTPTVGGTATITIKATDASAPAQTATASFTLTVYTATVQVDTTKALATVPQTGFGIHTSVYDNSFNNSAVPALLATDGITMMRYPGGLYSDNYHWAQDATTPFFTSSAPACKDVSNGYLAADTDFGHFVQVLKSASAGAIITVNYGTSVSDAVATLDPGTYSVSINGVQRNDCEEPNTSGQPQEAAAWVAYANGDPASTQGIGLDGTSFDWKTVGYWASLRAAKPLATDDGYNFLRLGQTAPIGVTYWEIGNELFYNGYVNNINSETDDHAPYDYPTGYSGTYNSRAGNTLLSPSAYGTNAVAYINAMKAVDPTIKIGFVLNSDNVTGNPIPLSWNPAAMQSVCAGASFDFGIIHYYPGSYNATTAAQMLLDPQKDYPALTKELEGELAQYCPANAGAVQFFVTETGPNGTTTLQSSQMAVEGLFAANDYLSALESGVQNIDWLELHSNYLETANEAPDPPYYGIELAHLLAHVGDSLVSSSSSYGNVVVHASKQASGATGILLINADPTNTAYVQVTVSGSTLGGTATEYSYGTGTTQSGAALIGTSFTVSGNTFTITVPAYTATELIVP